MAEPVRTEAWLVVAADGFRAVFINRTAAENYAARCHGLVHPLVREVQPVEAN